MSIKLLNLNLYEGGLLFDNIFSFFEDQQPDILTLQEVYDGKDQSLPDNFRTLEVLQSRLPEYEYHFGPEFLIEHDLGTFELGNAIFSKFPIVSFSNTDLGIPYGKYPAKPPSGDYGSHPHAIQKCQIEIESEMITVCNLHGVWDLDGERDTEKRLTMSQIIVDQIKDKRKVILTGDFNVQRQTKTIKNIEQHLHNVFGDSLETSFNLKHKDLEAFPGYATAVVDMIFASDDIKITDFYSPKADVSDHVPLVIEFEL